MLESNNDIGSTTISCTQFAFTKHGYRFSWTQDQQLLGEFMISLHSPNMHMDCGRAQQAAFNDCVQQQCASQVHNMT